MQQLTLQIDEKKLARAFVAELARVPNTFPTAPSRQPDDTKTGSGFDEASVLADGLMRVSEVAKFLALGRTKVYEMLDEGKLPYVRIDGGRRVPRKAVMDFAEEHLVEN